MTNRLKQVSWAIVCIVGMACASAALWSGWRAAAPAPPGPPALATGTMLEPRRELPDFSLIDHKGRPFTRADLRGSWSLLYFGYTNCPDACPATLATLAAFEKRLRIAADPVRPRVVFVSVDAARDTPAQLSRYVPYFDPDFLGVTAADQRAIEAVAEKMGIAVAINRRADGNYSVDHTGEILVVDPSGALAAILVGPFNAEALLGDFRRIAAGAS